MKNNDIKLTSDIADEIATLSLEQHLKFIKEDIKNLKKKSKHNNLKDFESKELINLINLKESFEKVIDYYVV